MRNNAIVTKAVRGYYTVVSPYGDIQQCTARGVFRKRGQEIYTGDYVTVEESVITEVLPRKNEMIRPPLANLDQIGFVVSLCDPLPNIRLLDQFLAVALYKEIRPIILFTKIDKSSPGSLLTLYQEIGISCYAVDYTNPDCIEQIRSEFAGKLSAFTGNSGVGKSTLLNALDSSLCIPTAEISQKLGRGKHTTRHAILYPFANGFLADTAGFSTFETARYAQIPRLSLAECFPEFVPYLGGCRFRDCSHTCEKDCAVLRALAEKKISQSRHDSYVAMYEEIKQAKEWET